MGTVGSSICSTYFSCEGILNVGHELEGAEFVSAGKTICLGLFTYFVRNRDF